MPTLCVYIVLFSFELEIQTTLLIFDIFKQRQIYKMNI